MLATLLKPNAGSATVNGFDVVNDAVRVRAEVGYLAHVPGLYDDLTAHENLRFAADMLGISHAALRQRLTRARKKLLAELAESESPAVPARSRTP